VKHLLSPRWIAAHIVVVVIAIAFIGLGLWQLTRLDERKIENAVAASRYEAPAEDLGTLLDGAGPDLESLRYRRAVVTGTYEPSLEVLTRNQVHQDQAGFHVVDPLITADGGAVLVNRGWVPLALDTPPIEEAPPPGGEIEVTGWLSPSQERPALGPTDPATGELDVLSRIDIRRIQAQVPYDLAPVYLILASDVSGQLPVALPSPRFDDEGNHLAYAIQWFGFTLIGLVGYYFLIRRSVHQPRQSTPAAPR
jgi:surfeit locus 1 family protein